MGLDNGYWAAQDATLAKVAEVGLQETVEALSNLTGVPFKVSAAGSTTSTFETLSASSHEEVSVGIYMAVEGDVPGHMASLCSWECACMMWNALLGAAPESPKDVTELEASMLLEVGNIMNAAFLRAVVNEYGVNLLATPPAVGIDMTNAILSTFVSHAADSQHDAVALRNVIETADGQAEWLFLFVGAAEDLRGLFGQVGLREVA